MPTIKALFNRTVRSFNRMHFDRACQAVLDIPPITVGGANGARIVSMLRHSDVPMYLAAVKSFASWIPINDVQIVNDGTLQADDITTLSQHVPGVQILDIRKFRSDRCPIGGCWERLLAIADLSRDIYTIQLDADTLAIADIPEVAEHVAAQQSFTIGTWDGQGIDSMSAAHRLAQRTITSSSDLHVQLLTESRFNRLKDFARLHYVRGCAGFMGFAAGSLDRAEIERLSAELKDVVGPAWETWGSEQVMANILVANTPGAAVLPHPKYCNCDRIEPEGTAFIHFVGSCRFQDTTYASHLSRTLSRLRTHMA